MDEQKLFWVFVDKPSKKVKLHLASCGACKGGRGMHGHREDECWWEGFTTRASAWDYAVQEACKINIIPSHCGLCHP